MVAEPQPRGAASSSEPPSTDPYLLGDSPGGVVAPQEPEASAWICDPPHPAWDTLRDALVAAYGAAGKNFNRGRTVARPLLTPA
jgi:hypothetical protein